MTKDRTAYVDWPRLLGDIAWMLGEDEPNVPNSRQPLSEVKLAEVLGLSRSKLKNISEGISEKVEYHEGCELILRWSSLSGKPREFVPITVRSFSRAAFRERAPHAKTHSQSRKVADKLHADIAQSSESVAVLASRHGLPYDTVWRIKTGRRKAP